MSRIATALSRLADAEQTKELAMAKLAQAHADMVAPPATKTKAATEPSPPASKEAPPPEPETKPQPATAAAWVPAAHPSAAPRVRKPMAVWQMYAIGLAIAAVLVWILSAMMLR